MTLLNVSNHPSSGWSSKQLEAAQAAFGNVIDVPFPAVSSSATTDEVVAMAEALVASAPAAEAAMVQGEFTLTLALVRIMQARGVKCLAACSDRRTVESTDSTGKTTKTAVFEFVQFREYP